MLNTSQQLVSSLAYSFTINISSLQDLAAGLFNQAIAEETCKGSSFSGQLRIEMTPLGNDHASDHNVIMLAVNLFAILKGIDFNGKDNCTYRKTEFQDAQPDASYYIGENADAIPYGTSIIDLDRYPPPELVIEVAKQNLYDRLSGSFRSDKCDRVLEILQHVATGLFPEIV